MMGRWSLFGIGLIIVAPLTLGSALLVPASFPPGTKAPVDVSIPAGSDSKTIAEELITAHVLGSSALFRIAVHLAGAQNELKAGDYSFPHGLSPLGAVTALRSGRFRSNEVSLRFREEWTLEEIAAQLDAAGVVVKADFASVATNPSAELRALVPGLPPHATLYGYLFADTYRFLKHSSAEAVAKRFLNNFAVKRSLLPAPTGSAIGHSFNEVVILASIVEREVKIPADRPKVADLFWRRLVLGMPLQSDMTVAYAVGKPATALTSEDFQSPSPYNTYKHPGLPAGPISNPGLESLRATLNPTANAALYFITNPADGSVIFASTLAEQNANQAKYLK